MAIFKRGEFKWLLHTKNAWNGKIPFIHQEIRISDELYGGTGESPHKQFVKAPGQKTQSRVSEFAGQTALQFYDILVTNHALRSIPTNENSMEAQSYSDQHCTLTDGDEVSVQLRGKYNLRITNDVIQLMMNGEDIEVDWHSDKKKRKKNNTLYCLDKELVKVLLKELREKNITGLGEEFSIEGYTRATTTTKHEN